MDILQAQFAKWRIWQTSTKRDRLSPVVGIPQNLPYSGATQFVERQAGIRSPLQAEA